MSGFFRGLTTFYLTEDEDNSMNEDLVLKTTQQVCSADVDTIREVYLEAICVLGDASTSFILKSGEKQATVVRSTLPSLMNVNIPNHQIRLEDNAFCLTSDEMQAWQMLPPVADGRMQSIIARRFSVAGEGYLACAGASSPDAFSEETLAQFNWTAPLGAHTVQTIRTKAKYEREKLELSKKIEDAQDLLLVAEAASDHLEGANAQLSNALLEVSSAKAQSKALLLTVGIGILLFAVSEFQIEPWLEASGVSASTLVYQKILILGGLVPIQVLVERFISSKVNSNASMIRVSMYEEVLGVLLEDGALTEKELKWLELYRRQQGVLKEEAQAVEARMRTQMLTNSRKKLQNRPAGASA